MCVASPRLPRHIVPSVTLARPPRPPGCCRVGGSQNEPLLCQSPKSGWRERRPAGDTQGHRPRWGARHPGSTQGGDGGRAGDGVGGARGGAGSSRAVSSEGPGCWGPGASPPPLRPGVAWRLAQPGVTPLRTGVASARPEDPAPTGSASSPPAPSHVLTLLPGATCHHPNPGPVPAATAPRI